MSHLTRRDWFKTAVTVPVAAYVFPSRSFAAPSAADLKPVVDKAVKFLESSQKEAGNFFPKAGEPGLTALIVASLLRNGVPADNSVIKKATKYLEGDIKPDGGVYEKSIGNYTTCLAIVAFKEMNSGGKYDKVIENAVKYVKGIQKDSDPDDVQYGGVGYDGKSRPDLSNTQFMVDALIAAGVNKDDPAIKKALVYVGRCQNLKSEYNTEAYAAKASGGDVGGFVYNPLDAKSDRSNKKTAEGGLRSEGGMTYAGLKSFLYAGVSKEDKRVKAAIAWVRKHYTLSENPGEGQAGLFYYYQTFAKAMAALGEEPFVDAKGVKHDWKQELFDELKKKQKENGSWANPNRQFLEDVPELATAFALLALSYCEPK